MILILYIMPNFLAGLLNRISCSMLRSIDIEVTLKGTEGKVLTQDKVTSHLHVRGILPRMTKSTESIKAIYQNS